MEGSRTISRDGEPSFQHSCSPAAGQPDHICPIENVLGGTPCKGVMGGLVGIIAATSESAIATGMAGIRGRKNRTVERGVLSAPYLLASR